MNAEKRSPPETPNQGFLGQLDDLGRRIERARAGDALTVEAAALLQDLETAHEELRVADEEVRVQQEQIARLLRGERVLRQRHERLLADLPIAVVTTDQFGLVQSGNTAAERLLNVGVDRMLLWPVFAFVGAQDRRVVREMLTAVTKSGGIPSREVTLLPKGREPLTASLSVSTPATAEPGGHLTWLIVTTAGSFGAPSANDYAALPQALLALADLDCTGGLEDLLPTISVTSQQALPSGMGLGLVVGASPGSEAVVATTPEARCAVDMQRGSRQGPMMDARTEQGVVTSADVRTDARWPALQQRLAETDVAIAVAAPLRGGEGAVGALMICGGSGMELDQRLVTVCELLAAAVSNVLQELSLHGELRNLAADMEQALSSRAVIDQAKGIVMADKGISADDAFQHLVELSSRLHLKLRDLARMLVDETGRRPA